MDEHQSNYYNYMAKQLLVKDPGIISDTDEYSRYELCVYSINTSGKYPFIQYLLTNDGFNKLIFPVLPVYSTFNKDTLQSYSKVFLSGILKVENFEMFNSQIDFNGFYEFQNTLYLFFDVTKCELKLDDTYSDNITRFALIDEVINRRNVSNIPLDSSVFNFFSQNPSFNFLYDINNDPYEIPIVGYVGKQSPEKLNFVYTFGESAKNKSALLGPYYYFTDFFNAIRQDKPEKKCGIVRFALFQGITKYIENFPNDPIDESEIRKEIINDNSMDMNHEIQLMRISDHDGSWTLNYNSVYLANIELDDGSYIEDTPLIVLKEYSQQLPISYHFIDKNKFVRDNYEYSIV